ncbi:MAG: lipopolysaccharide biosynthesis protein [Myxococcaceae bacterium]|nr:lipopolysaccharide biosynthesis protein [Myxococcaceae bacterium]
MTDSDGGYLKPLAQDEVGRRAARGGAFLAVAQIVRSLIEASATVILARALLPSDFGLVDMIVSVTGAIDMLKEFGLSSATIQKENIEQAQVSLLFWINCAIGLVLTLITAALAPVLSLVYGRPELTQFTLVLALATFLGALPVQHQALLRRNLRFGALTAIELLVSLVSNGVGVWAALHGYGAWSLVMRQLVRFGSLSLFTFVFCRWRPSLPARANVRELLTFGKHVSGFQLLNYLERNLDNVLVGRFAGPAQLGFYSKAYGLMRVPLDQVNALASVAIPTLSRLLPDQARYLDAYRSLTALILLLTIPLAPLAIYSADLLIPAVLGEQWRGSVPIFQWLALGLAIKPLLNTSGWLFISQARTRELWRWSLVGSPIAIASFFVGLPWGALGVAIAYTAADAFLRAPLLLFWIGRKGPVRTRDMLLTLAPAWTCAGALALSYPPLHRTLSGLAEGPRCAASALGSLLVGWLVVYLTPWGRRALHDGARMFALLRKKRG